MIRHRLFDSSKFQYDLSSMSSARQVSFSSLNSLFNLESWAQSNILSISIVSISANGCRQGRIWDSNSSASSDVPNIFQRKLINYLAFPEVSSLFKSLNNKLGEILFIKPMQTIKRIWLMTKIPIGELKMEQLMEDTIYILLKIKISIIVNLAILTLETGSS